MFTNHRNSLAFKEIGVGEHDGDVRFFDRKSWTCEHGYGSDTMFHRSYSVTGAPKIFIGSHNLTTPL